MRRKFNFWVVLVIPALFGAFIANAQGSRSGGAKLPLDPLVKTGRLANGLTYYIRRNTEPEKRATMYLVVKAGSILETEEQQGLAHFMEHMSFNGTKHFPKNELIDYLQRSGIRFGADLNAYTGFDETVYQLPIPTDNPDIVQHGLQILRDWAQEATLDVAEINSERGVVLEEKRLRLGAEQRIQEKTLPMLLNGCRYARRLPIGTEEVLKNFKPAVIRSFYKDWYRPDLQAVIIVGDIDPAVMEKRIKALFADLRNPEGEKKRTVYAIPLTGKNQFLSVTDAEVPEVSLSVIIKSRAFVNKTEADFRWSLILNLFASMSASRLSESAKRPDVPFLKLSGGYSGIMGDVVSFSMELVPRKGEMKAGFLAAWREVEGMRRNGFVASELLRAKQSLLSTVETGLKEKDKQSSTALADQLKELFLKGEAVPGIEKEAALVKRILPGITLAEINQIAKQYIKGQDRDIIVSGPDSRKTELPTEGEVLSWIGDVEKGGIAAFTESVESKGLIEGLPATGKVVSEKHFGEIGVTEWTLSNGARVVLKPTDFKNDEVRFMVASPGGTSLYSDQDYESAANAAGIVASFGLGRFDNIALPKMLSGKQLSVQPFISERMEGFQGGASREDLGTAMELLHLYFTSPRKDTALFSQIIRNSAERIASRYADPEAVFADTVAAVLGAHNLRRTGPTLYKLHSISLDKVMEVYKERFANAGDFTFFFVGNIDTAALRSLVEKYIGSLPGTGTREQARDLGVHIPPGKIATAVVAGKEDKATVRLVFSGDYAFGAENNLLLRALQEILQYRLTERLRETEGGVYTPSAQMNNTKYPNPRYNYTIAFGCAPANVEKLIAATLDEMRKLKENGISAEDLQKFKAEELRQNELAAKDNGFWLNYISGQYLNQEDPIDFLKLNEAIGKLDTATLQQAAKTFFNGDNYARFVLLPGKQ